MPTGTVTQFDPYTAEEDLYADLPDGRTILVAAKGVQVTPQLLHELRVVSLPRRVDEPSQHSPEGDLVAAAATTAAAAAGVVEPHNELQRQGKPPAAVVVSGVEASEHAGEVHAEVRPADDEPDSDGDEAKKSTGPRPRTGAKPAPKEQ